MTNIVKETLEELKYLGLKSEDVLWVGSHDGKYAMPWDQFQARFENVTYDSGFGAQEIAEDLVVVGANWWLEREEYDGSERWAFKQLPVRFDDAVPFHHVKHPEGHGWRSLADCNNEGEEND